MHLVVPLACAQITSCLAIGLAMSLRQLGHQMVFHGAHRNHNSHETLQAHEQVFDPFIRATYRDVRLEVARRIHA